MMKQKFDIPLLEQSALKKIQSKIDLKTKPPGSLGQLEKLAVQLALITGEDKIVINQPTLLVFAADQIFLMVVVPSIAFVELIKSIYK